MPWILSDFALLGFALFALLEYGASLNGDLRGLYENALWLLQPGSAFVVNYSYANYEYSAFLEMVNRVFPTETLVAALPATGVVADIAISSVPASSALAQVPGAGLLATVLPFAWAALMGFGTWILGRVRATVVGFIYELDEDNSLGLQTLLRWTENSWVAVGALLLIIAPIVALALAGLTVATLFLLRKYFEHREQRTLRPCASCATMIHPSAPACPRCRLPQEQPRVVGLFGQAKDRLVTDMTEHRLQLLARKRCPACATRLKVRGVQQACPMCERTVFADISEFNQYVRALDQRLSRTLLICFGFSLIPVVGVVPGVVYYRLSLVASLNSYLPRSIGCLTRWGVRIASLALLAFQAIPVIGAFSLPLLCLLNYTVYRQVLQRYSLGKLHRTFDPLSAALTAGANRAPAAVASLPLAGQPSEPTPTQQRCGSCQASSPKEYRFCTTCGASLAA